LYVHTLLHGMKGLKIKSRVYENGALMRILGPKKEEVT
jgi:hypothetical protein